MDRSFFHFVTIHAFVRRADGQTDRQLSHRYTASATLHSMQRGNKVVKSLSVVTFVPDMTYNVFVGTLNNQSICGNLFTGCHCRPTNFIVHFKT